MPKRKPFASTQNPHAIQLESPSVAGYNGPITRSRVLRGHSSPTPLSLPLEVLGEILVLALPTDQELYKKCSSEGRKLINPTLALCAACSTWRFLAFSIPRLWNRVLIHVPHNIEKAQAERKAADLVQWIERARSLPITLHAFGDFNMPLHRKGPADPIISVINDHASRWESLYLQGFQPSLSLLHFDRWHSLRRVYCPFSESPSSCTNETIPWAHLTHLQIRQSIPCLYARLIFARCPKLVYLSILVTNPPRIGQIISPIVLEDLVTFHFRTYSVDRLQMLVYQLSLPSLREFSIDGISTKAIQPVLNLLTQSSCSLDKLEIRGLHLSSGDFLNVLTHSSCDSLTSLTLRPSFHKRGGSFDKEMLQRLTLHRNDTVCHHLTFLAIDYCITTPLHSALLNMVESRIKSHTGQVPEEPVLRYLQLHVKYRKKKTVELDKVGRRSGMEYTCDRIGAKPASCFSVRFRRQGFREPPNIGELF